MGLDVSHDCWSGAYSAFMRWRTEIAKAAGIPLMLMEGFSGGLHGPEAHIALVQPSWLRDTLHDEIGKWLPIKWESLKPDPIHALLNHSDCEGDIAAADCGPIAERLTELLPLMPKGDGGGHIRDWTETTQAFIDGLRRAAAAGEKVEFH